MAHDVDLDSVESLDTYLNYLDKLRESGITNMWGAALYLLVEFPELSHDQAKRIHTRWMRTFGERQQQKETKEA